MNSRFLFRELSYGRGQALIFVLCVALSLVSIVAVSGLRRDIGASLASDARSLSGGDVIVHSHYPFTEKLAGAIEKMSAGSEVRSARAWEFASMARDEGGQRTVLSQVKIVGPDYPLYGAITLGSGHRLGEMLIAGQIVVAPGILTRLQLKVGDYLLLGEQKLKIVDTVLKESLRPVEFLSFGPRIFVAAGDLDRLGLVGKGSRVHNEYLLRVADAGEIDRIATTLQQSALPGQERVQTYATSGSRVKNFFDNLLFFLSLTSVFTLLLAGIGMQSSLSALFRYRQTSLAIIRSLGVTSRFIYGHYFVLVLLLSCLGCVVGVTVGLILEKNFGLLFADILPPDMQYRITGLDLVEGLVVGLISALFFTFLPLLRLGDIKPAAIFRKESVASLPGKRQYLLILVGVVLFLTLVIHQLDDVRIGLYFLGGSLVLVALSAGAAALVTKLLAGWKSSRLVVRQAVRSLLRPGNNSITVMATLAAAMALLLSLFLLERNLHGNYVASYPEGAPNLFCLDIQKDQREVFLELAGSDALLFPVIRARLMAIGGEKVQRNVERRPRGDNLVREFNLTYRDSLLGDEELIDGTSLFGDEKGGNKQRSRHIPVSILDTVADMGDMKMGDVLDFNIQGVPLKAEVTSIRSRTRSMIFPFFYFVFPKEILADVPQTFFAALTVQEGEVGHFELSVVNRFPNITTIDVGETAAELGRIMRKLSLIITFFASFSIFAGALLLVSSILATRMERNRESVYYKVLGAGTGFVKRVFLLENLLLAVVSGSSGLILAQLISWAVCAFLLNTSYSPYFGGCLLMTGGGALLVVGLGVASSLVSIHRKPAQFLREQK